MKDGQPDQCFKGLDELASRNDAAKHKALEDTPQDDKFHRVPGLKTICALIQPLPLYIYICTHYTLLLQGILLVESSSLQTEDALKKLLDGLLVKVKKTKGLVKELRTTYDPTNSDVAKQSAQCSEWIRVYGVTDPPKASRVRSRLKGSTSNATFRFLPQPRIHQ